MEKIRIILGLCVVVIIAVAYPRADSSTSSAPGPDGEIVRFEGQNPEDYIALYEDRIEAESRLHQLVAASPYGESEDGPVVIEMSDIKSIKRSFARITIRSNDGAKIEFSLEGLGGTAAAKRFEKEVTSLIQAG